MTVTRTEKDPQNRTMTVHAEFDAPVDRTWQLWGDPRQLERWWGPPTYPATFTDHDLRASGTAAYFMTGPDGERFHGVWQVREVAAPTRLVVDDSFADANGVKNDGLPTTSMSVVLAERAGGGTTVTITSTFPSLEAMEQLIEMGMEDGLREAMSQMDVILAEHVSA